NVSRDCSPDCLVLTCPSDLQVECSSAGGTIVSFGVVATNTCGGIARVQTTQSSGSVFPSGVTTVTGVAEDGKGNTKRCTFKVSVRDSTPPRITAPTNLSVPCTNAAGATATFAVTATDTCDLKPTVTCTPLSGSLFPPGTTTVTCRATDSTGNSSTTNVSVAVSQDCQPDCLMLTCPRSFGTEATSTNGAVATFSVVA